MNSAPLRPFHTGFGRRVGVDVRESVGEGFADRHSAIVQEGQQRRPVLYLRRSFE